MIRSATGRFEVTSTRLCLAALVLTAVLLLGALMDANRAMAKAGAQSKGADLVVKSRSNLPSKLSQGDLPTIRLTVKNVGSKKAGRSALRLYISRGSKRSKSDRRFGPAVKVKPLMPKGSFRFSSRFEPPDNVRGRRFLIVCAAPAKREKGKARRNNCRTLGGPIRFTGAAG